MLHATIHITLTSNGVGGIAGGASSAKVGSGTRIWRGTVGGVAIHHTMTIIKVIARLTLGAGGAGITGGAMFKGDGADIAVATSLIVACLTLPWSAVIGSGAGSGGGTVGDVAIHHTLAVA